MKYLNKAIIIAGFALAAGFFAWTLVLLTFDLINFLHSLIQ